MPHGGGCEIGTAACAKLIQAGITILGPAAANQLDEFVHHDRERPGVPGAEFRSGDANIFSMAPLRRLTTMSALGGKADIDLTRSDVRL